MPSDPTRVTRSGRISKQTSRTFTPGSKQRDRSSQQPTSRSNQTKKETNATSTKSKHTLKALLKELLAEVEERNETTNTNREYQSRRSHGSHRASRSSSDSSTSSRRHRKYLRNVDHGFNRPLFSSLSCRFPLIKRIYIQKIYHGDFEARDLPQLADSYLAYPQTNEIDSLNKLLRCVENYGQIVCHFAPPESETALQRAFSSFRLTLLRFLEFYTFESVCEWCFCFIATRIVRGADDPNGWMDGALELRHKLVHLQSFVDECAIEEE